MRFIVKDMDIETGGPLIAIINKKDAKFLDLHNGDRVRLNYRINNAIAIIDIAESKKAVPSGKIGCFEELLKELKVKGKLFLSKPGKLRIEYEKKENPLIVADGKWLHYFDIELNEIQSVTIEKSPAWILLKKKV